VKALIAEDFESEAAEYGVAFAGRSVARLADSPIVEYEVGTEEWPRPIPSAEQWPQYVEAQRLAPALDADHTDDCPPIVMLIVIVAGVAVTGAIGALIVGLGG
jgi:hypothetical protein